MYVYYAVVVRDVQVRYEKYIHSNVYFAIIRRPRCRHTGARRHMYAIVLCTGIAGYDVDTQREKKEESPLVAIFFFLL